MRLIIETHFGPFSRKNRNLAIFWPLELTCLTICCFLGNFSSKNQTLALNIRLQCLNTNTSTHLPQRIIPDILFHTTNQNSAKFWQLKLTFSTVKAAAFAFASSSQHLNNQTQHALPNHTIMKRGSMTMILAIHDSICMNFMCSIYKCPYPPVLVLIRDFLTIIVFCELRV